MLHLLLYMYYIDYTILYTLDHIGMLICQESSTWLHWALHGDGFFVTSWGHLHHHLSTTRAAIDWTPEMSESGAATGPAGPRRTHVSNLEHIGTIGTMALGSLVLISTEFHRVAGVFPWCFPGRPWQPSTTDWSGRTLGCFAGKYGVQNGVQNGVLQMVCLSCNALRYMIKHVDGYLPPVDWKPSKLMKKIIIPIDPRAQITCRLITGLKWFEYVWMVCVDAQTKLKPGRVPAFSWDFCCFSPLTLLLGAQLRKSSLRLDVQINESSSVLVLLVLPLNPVTSGIICHHPPSCSGTFHGCHHWSSWCEPQKASGLLCHHCYPPEANPACLGNRRTRRAARFSSVVATSVTCRNKLQQI